MHHFVEEHNHPFKLPEPVHMLASQRHITEAQAQDIKLADDFRLQQKASFTFMSRHVGGRTNLGYTHLDKKNYLHTKRQKELSI